MSNSIYIPIHSFSDLITNSSSETYVSVTDATIDTIKNIIDNSIAICGGTQTANDLFTFEFCYSYDAGWIRRESETSCSQLFSTLGIDKSKLDKYYHINLTDVELENIKKFIHSYLPLKDFFDPRGYGGNRYLRVTPKNDTEISRKLAKLLENLITTLDTGS